MENYSRDLLSSIGGGDEADRGEQNAQQRFGSQTKEVELSLGLSLGGRLGQERRRSGEGSSSAAPIQEVAPAPPAPFRVNSVPPTADAEPGNKESSGGTSRAEVQVQPSATVQGGGFPLNVTAVQPAAQLPASFNPGAGSSSAGEGILAGTSSLPAGVDDAWKKRKAAQALRRLEVKRRIERMNSSKVSVEEVGKNQDEINAPAKEENVENLSMKNEQTGGKSEVKISGDLWMKNEQTGGQPKVERMNQRNVRRRPSGLPPLYKPPVAKQGSSMPGKPKMQNSALNGAPSAQGRILSSAAVPSSGGTNGVLQAGMAPAPSPALPVVAPAPSPASAVVAPASSPASAVVAPAPSPAPAVVAPAPSPAPAVAAAGLGSGGGQQVASERAAARATRGFINVGGTGVMVPVEVVAMPWVWTWMLPNRRIVQGILYSYSRADQVRIMCWCHGRLLSPAEFVEHAGGGQVDNPLMHIMVYRPRAPRM